VTRHPRRKEQKTDQDCTQLTPRSEGAGTLPRPEVTLPESTTRKPILEDTLLTLPFTHTQLARSLSAKRIVQIFTLTDNMKCMEQTAQYEHVIKLEIRENGFS